MARLRIYIAIPDGTTAEQIEAGTAVVSLSARPRSVVHGWPSYFVDVEVPAPTAKELEAATATPGDGA